MNRISELMTYFNYDHLPEKLQEVSKPFFELANQVMSRDAQHTRGETEAALRKLLEAKDCAVRAAL